jgi:epoxyqueuosine reductase
MTSDGSIADEVRFIALDAGFAACGMTRVPEPGTPEDYVELQHFDEFIDQGYAGEMNYLKRRDEAGQLIRSSLRVAIPWARSVIVCGANYDTDQALSIDPAPPDKAWIARYAWTGLTEADGTLRPSDYHKVLLKRLKSIESSLKERLGRRIGEFESRCYVDTGPLAERIYAKYAGIGWIGKNTCILNEQLGSWLFLGVIVTSIELPANMAQLPPPDRCGTCRRCIDACPTDALIAPYKMDATRCISYLTIENRGEIPLQLRPLVGRQVFGCDICQDVCPWNGSGTSHSPVSADDELATRDELVNPSLDWLGALDETGFERLFNGSPVRRAKYSGFRRNVAIAMGNSGLGRFLPRLRSWVEDDNPVVAEASRWAVASIETVKQ